MYEAPRGLPPPAECGPPGTATAECEPPELHERLKMAIAGELQNVRSDYQNFYSWHTLGELTLALGVSAAVANTPADQHIRNWYQQDVRSTTSNHIASFWKPFGNGAYTIPAMVGLDLFGKEFDQYPLMSTVGEFGDHALRAYAVGAPPLLALQELIGSGRPADPGRLVLDAFQAQQRRRGHAFIGAVPFITAAKMTDDPFGKGLLYACSMMTGWSRINDDAHYFSQVWLGWWLAYFSCEAVDGTQLAGKNITVMPLVTPEMSGIG